MAKRAAAVATRPAKKPTRPLKETEPANDLEANLVDLLKALDNLGVSMVESQWREMTEAENNSVVEWASRRRIGTRSPLPLCLRGYASADLLAEQDQYLAAQEEGRKVLCPCVFCKPSFDKSEEGDETVRMKIKVPDSNLSGSTARELFGKTRVRVEFSRRPIAEWEQMELTDGPRRIVCCETEIPSFGWSDGNWSFPFLIDADVFSLEDAIDAWKKQGSVRLCVIGQALEGDDSGESAAPKRKPGRPKKEPAAPKPDGPTLPGMTDGDLTESHSVSLTKNYRLNIGIAGLPEGKFSCFWDGIGPAGACDQGEPSIRTSINEAAKASIGHAIDRWSSNPDDESKLVVANLRDWLGALESGKSPKLIESEMCNEDDSEDDEESQV